MTPRLPPRHSEPVTDVTGVGIRVPRLLTLSFRASDRLPSYIVIPSQ